MIKTFLVLKFNSGDSKFSYIYLDKCSPNNANVCKHGGKCTVEENGNVTCMCTILYSGRRCEISKLINSVNWNALKISRH